jgi:hypothetical protein
LSWRRELKPVNLLLLAGIACLLVAIIHVWWGGGGSLPSRSPSEKGAQVPTAPILRDQQPMTAFAVIPAKNLFSQDRSGPLQGPAQVQNSLEGRELLGIMVIGDTKAAIIGGKPTGLLKGAPDIEAVYQGEEWHELKVLEISNDSVTFAGKDGQKTLKFPE